MAMNPEVKARWVAALRSGEYKQTTGCLSRADGFCCLGVLCDLHAKETGTLWTEGDTKRSYFGVWAVLPPAVGDWASLSEELGGTVVIGGEEAALTEHNDGITSERKRTDVKRTFSEIATAIEEQL